jgi:hypothetical protein
MQRLLLGALVATGASLSVCRSQEQKHDKKCFVEKVRPAASGTIPNEDVVTRAGRPLFDVERKRVEDAIDIIESWATHAQLKKRPQDVLRKTRICVETVKIDNGAIAATTFPSGYGGEEPRVIDGKEVTVVVTGVGECTIHLMPHQIEWAQERLAPSDVRDRLVELALVLYHEVYHIDTAEKDNSRDKAHWEIKAYNWCIQHMSVLLGLLIEYDINNADASNRKKLPPDQLEELRRQIALIQRYINTANEEIARLLAER